MTRRRRVLLALCIALLAAPAATHAACELETGTGGTGVRGEPGSGSGGTGVQGPGTGTGTGGTGLRGDDTGTGGTGLDGDRDGGIGGSGLQADRGGVGGTGVLGTVTGFGSVCVNGLEVEYDSDVSVEIDGAAASVGALAIGQVVRIRASGAARSLRARHITVETALAGPIDSFDPASGRLVVMGQTVAIDASTRRAAELRAGARVGVSGLRRGDGVLVASRIDARAASAADLVTGRALGAGPSALYVGDVRADAAAPPDGSGARVQLEGRWDGARRSLVVARSRAALAVEAGEGRASLEGYVAREAGELRVHGIAFDAPMREGAAAEVREGDRVRLEGRVRDGRLQADWVRIDHRAEHGDRNDERGERGERSGRSERGDRGDRSDRPDRPDRAERPERSERPERAERPDRPDRSGRD